MMTQRICAALVLCLFTFVADSAAGNGVSVKLELVDSVVSLGEPFDVTIRLSNAQGTPLITTYEALAGAILWSHLQLVEILADGTEIQITVDRPLLSPSPSSLWIVRNGAHVAVRPAVILEPGSTIEVTIANLLRYFPLVDAGNYRLALVYELPVYGGTVTDSAYGEMELVVVEDADWLSVESDGIAFALELSDEITGRDVEWFRLSREMFTASRSVEEAIGAFMLPNGTVSAHVQACSHYWIGEAYQLYWAFDRAATAYEDVVAGFADSVFAGYAEDRLAEIAELQETQSP